MDGRFARVWRGCHGWATGDCASEKSISLLIEEQAEDTIKFAFSNLSTGIPWMKAVGLWHERWKIE